MSIIKSCTRKVACTTGDTSVEKIARLMRAEHMGCIIIVDESKHPIGLVTDRDLVMEIVAENLPPDSMLVEDIMTMDPVTIDENDDLTETLEKMRAKAVRRAPVVDATGCLTGIVSVDDILTYLGGELNNIITLINKGRIKERRERGIKPPLYFS